MKQHITSQKLKLELLLKITKAINKNLSADELLFRYSRLLVCKLRISKFLIFQKREDWRVLLASQVPDHIVDAIDIEKDLEVHKTITRILYESAEYLKEFDYIIPVFHENEILAYVLISDSEQEDMGVSPVIKHLLFIQTMSNIVFVAVENKRMQEEMLVQEGVKKEMELAAQVQSLLIPSDCVLPQNEHICTKGFYHPHFHIGGDYYDFLEINNSLCFCIGDVAGKGISAGMVMANLQAQVRALLHAQMPLKEIIIELNRRMGRNVIEEKFITFFIGIYNYAAKKLQYINAGHYPPVLFDVATKKTLQLSQGCIGLGMIEEIPSIQIGQIEIKNPSKVFCFTDGLVELKEKETILLQIDRVVNMITNDRKIEHNFSDLKDYIDECIAKGKVLDDIAMIGIDIL